MSGPLWTGPLHNAKDIHEMIALTKEWGWVSDEAVRPQHVKRKNDELEMLLHLMLEESNPELPFGYIHLDEVAFVIV
jgi:tRNA (guanine26-N2/guanine27-N2)-dimethyltransferase